MIYVFYGTESYLIDKEIQKIKKQNKIDSFCFQKYNMDETTTLEIIEDANTIPMFGQKKLILCENAFFLTGNSKKIGTEIDIDKLSAYIENPNKDSILIFTVFNEKLDERKKIVKILKKYGIVKSFQDERNPLSFCRTLFEGYKIDEDTLLTFQDRVGDHSLLLEKEAEKLKLYRYEEKEITKQDVLSLTSQNVDLNIFTFIDNIITKKKEKALITYEEMMKRNEEPIAMIVMLANQFRIMYQAKELLKRGYTEKQIASLLSLHPFRVKKALEKARSYTSETLLSYLKKLIDLDINIKTGKIEKNFAFELFILEI